MDAAQFDKLIQMLEHIRERPGMYFADTASAIDNFISGLDVAMRVFLDDPSIDATYTTLLRERGFERNKSLYQQFREKGLDDASATNEYLSIIIEMYKNWRTQS